MKPQKNYFLPYQNAWIADNSPLKIAVKSRQIGLSHADNYHSVILANAKGAKLNQALDLGLPHLPWGDKGYLPNSVHEIGERAQHDE